MSKLFSVQKNTTNNQCIGFKHHIIILLSILHKNISSGTFDKISKKIIRVHSLYESSSLSQALISACDSLYNLQLKNIYDLL